MTGRLTSSGAAAGWRRIMPRISAARWRSASRQSAPPAGGGCASQDVASTMPSSSASLFSTWLYSDMPCTPSSAPSLCIDSAASPLASTNSSAARSTFALVSRGRATPSSAVPAEPATAGSPAAGLPFSGSLAVARAARARGAMVPSGRSFSCKLTAYGLPSSSSLCHKARW